MDRAAEIDILKTLLHYLDTKTTCMADAPWRNEVTAFTCPERNKREQDILIRQASAGHGALLRLAQARLLPDRGLRRRADPHRAGPATASCALSSTCAGIAAPRWPRAAAAPAPSPAPITAGPTATTGCCAASPRRHRPSPASGPSARASRRCRSPRSTAWSGCCRRPPPTAPRDLDIEPWLDGLGPDLAFWKLDGYHFHDRHVHYEEMNWKLLVDTFHEGYHFGFLHKESLSGILVHNVGHFTPVRAQLPPRVRTHQARPPQEHARERVGPDVEHRRSSTRCSPIRSSRRRATTWRSSACSPSTGGSTAR